MEGKWSQGDTVYLEPEWNELTFLKGHEDYEYKDLREKCEAVLLSRSSSLTAVPTHDDRDKPRKARQGTWYETFEDAVEAVVTRKLNDIVSSRERAYVAFSMVQHYRKRAAEAAGAKEK